jgi:DNA modification methylase
VKPFYEHAGIRIYVGDCREVIPQLEESFDACVTDPPYHLTTGKKGGSGPASVNLESPYGRARIGTGFMGKAWDGGDVAFRPETWEVVSRVLKPGAHVMAFGGTRTFHRLACAIEDAGFEIRDMLMWLYGSGFPKSLDISKAIDRAAGAERKVVETRRVKGGGTEHINRGNLAQDFRPGAYQKGENVLDVTEPATEGAKLWDGYGTALKPAWEPIILGMKPCAGTFAENALGHGVAGLNIDGSRIDLDGDYKCGANGRPSQTGLGDNYDAAKANQPSDVGRWPANLILDEEAAALLDDQSGISESGAMRRDVSGYVGESNTNLLRGASGPSNQRADSGGASRFFYTAKADSAERGTGNNHPTVKPLDLMRYLCKLLAPPSGGLFLEPFAGSGTTLIACKALNIRAVGIELSEEYAEIAAKRLSQDVLEFT